MLLVCDRTLCERYCEHTFPHEKQPECELECKGCKCVPHILPRIAKTLRITNQNGKELNLEKWLEEDEYWGYAYRFIDYLWNANRCSTSGEANWVNEYRYKNYYWVSRRR